MAKPVYDAISGLDGGMHAGIDPERLAETAFSRGINLDIRGGLAGTRAGFTSAVTLPAGRFQGMAAWELPEASRLVVVIAGHVYTVDTTTYAVTDHGLLLDTAAQVYFCAVDKFFVLQDGASTPVVLQDLTGVAEVRPQAHTIPVGYAMVYAHWRLHVIPKFVLDATGAPTAERGEFFFLSSDPLSALDPSNVLQFVAENNYWNDGGANGNPLQMGRMHGFGALRNAATGTGYGGIVAFSERGVAAYDVSTDRATWKDEQFAQVLYFGPGTRSPWSIVHANGTLLYRSIDGIRILSYSTTNAQSTGESLSNAPQSTEVGPYLDEDDAYLPYVSSAVCDNRAFVTCGGYGDRQFRALVCLDLAAISGAQDLQSRVAYNGIWQIGGRYFQAVTSAVAGNRERLFAVLDGNELVFHDPAAVVDLGAQKITARLVSRVLLLGESGPDLKRLTKIDAWFRDIAVSTSATAYYRPAGYPLWLSAGVKVFAVETGSLPQVRRGVQWNIPDAVTAADPATKQFLRQSSGFQIALDLEGSAVIQFIRVEANPEMSPPQSCVAETAVKIVAGTHGQLLEDFL